MSGVTTPPPPPPPPPPPGIPPHHAEAPRRAVPGGVVIAVGVISAVVITAGAGGLGLFVNHLHSRSPLARVSPSPGGLTPTSGAVVFSDDFHDPNSGWSTGTLASGTTIGYSNGHYVIVAKGSLQHYANAPYKSPLDELEMSVTATQSPGAPAGAGFGVLCYTGTGVQQVTYQFL